MTAYPSRIQLVELDMKPVKRAIRPVALGRENFLLADSEEDAGRQAIVASLIESAKLDSVEPYAWSCGTRFAWCRGIQPNRLNELMPWMRNF